VLVAGGAGFIGSHLCRRLRSEGNWVVAADWATNLYFEEHEFCDEFVLLDLRSLENCIKATAGCEWVFNLAADMGGMGFIQANHSVILYNNTMISYNMLEASRRNKVKRFFYASSACIYPEHAQLDPNNPGLKESTAWPAQPQDAYGLEKLASEEMCKHYMSDFGLITRVGRFHNIYGPHGTWCGGREKSPAAFCRKVLANSTEIEIWGDGKQTRSYCYVDACVEGILRLFHSDCGEPLNVGSDEVGQKRKTFFFFLIYI
jgi:GDP-D-mannose 3',5'-epimerase